MSIYKIAVTFVNVDKSSRIHIAENPWGEGFPAIDYEPYTSIHPVVDFAKNMHSKGEDFFVVRFRGDIDCREILMGRIQNIQRYLAHEVSTVGRFVVSYYHILVLESSNQKDFQERWVDFGREFIDSQMSLVMSLKVIEGMAIMNVKLPNSNSGTSMYFLSTLLWCFRHRIDTLLMKECSGNSQYKGNLRNFALKMSELFLKNKSWGDRYNSSFHISMALFAFAKSYQIPGHLDGPSSAGQWLTFPQVLSYLKQMYIPAFPESSHIDTEIVGTIDEDLALSMSYVLDLIKNSKEEKE